MDDSGIDRKGSLRTLAVMAVTAVVFFMVALPGFLKIRYSLTSMDIAIFVAMLLAFEALVYWFVARRQK